MSLCNPKKLTSLPLGLLIYDMPEIRDFYVPSHSKMLWLYGYKDTADQKGFIRYAKYLSTIGNTEQSQSPRVI